MHSYTLELALARIPVKEPFDDEDDDDIGMQIIPRSAIVHHQLLLTSIFARRLHTQGKFCAVSTI